MRKGRDPLPAALRLLLLGDKFVNEKVNGKNGEN